MYPTKEQEQHLLFVLRRCRKLYNSALEERRAPYQMCHTGIGYTCQAAELPDIKAAFPASQEIHSQVLQDVLRRVDKTFAAFSCRVASSEKPGYQRFKSTSRYRSFIYPQSGFALAGNVLPLSKRGDFKVRLHRPMMS